MTEHYDKDPDGTAPRTLQDLDAMGTLALWAFAENCTAEPAEPEKCLACAAYLLVQQRED
jgi:hypothetical protein